MKFYHFRILFIYILIFLFSCNGSNEPDGGPCTYDKNNYPATVIGIEMKDSLNAEIYFRVNDSTGNVYRDSVSWSMEKKEWMPLSRIAKDSVTIGKKYSYKVWKIITGHCNPNIEILELEKYQ